MKLPLLLFFSCGHCHHFSEDSLDAEMQFSMVPNDADKNLYKWSLGVELNYVLS